MRLYQSIFLILFLALPTLSLQSEQDSLDVKQPAMSTALFTTDINSSGLTSLKAPINNYDVKIKIDTTILHRSNIAFPGLLEKFTNIDKLTIVKSLSISVNNINLFVPYSIFADLINPTKASLYYVDNSFVITIHGDDASYAYFVRVYFDAKQIKRRVFYDPLTNEPTQDTQYSIREPM